MPIRDYQGDGLSRDCPGVGAGFEIAIENFLAWDFVCENQRLGDPLARNGATSKHPANGLGGGGFANSTVYLRIYEG